MVVGVVDGGSVEGEGRPVVVPLVGVVSAEVVGVPARTEVMREAGGVTHLRC